MTEKTLKTPSYTRRASDNHRKKLATKNVTINKETEADLLMAIESDKTQSFNSLVKQLLRQHYKLD